MKNNRQIGSATMGLIGLFSFLALVAVGVAVYYSNSSPAASNNLVTQASKQTSISEDLGLSVQVVPGTIPRYSSITVSWTASNPNLVYYIVGIRELANNAKAPGTEDRNAGKSLSQMFSNILLPAGQYYADLKMVLSDGTIKEDKKTFSLL